MTSSTFIKKIDPLVVEAALVAAPKEVPSVTARAPAATLNT
jgi:hypothetical protein